MMDSFSLSFGHYVEFRNCVECCIVYCRDTKELGGFIWAGITSIEKETREIR